jgi:[ribosomal protein S5]-alanine N-acetyltransferase
MQSARLFYREFNKMDRHQLVCFKDDPAQLKYMHFSICSDKEIEDFLHMAIEQAESRNRSQWHLAIAEKGKEDIIGSVALMVEKDSPSSAEIGYWFKKEYWGKGYASEATNAMITFGFKEIRLHRIWGKCHVDNPASAKVMKNNGMTYEGTLREHIWLRDHYRSSLIFSILESEYNREEVK